MSDHRKVCDERQMPTAPYSHQHQAHQEYAPRPVVHQPVGMSHGNVVIQQRPTRHWNSNLCGCCGDPILSCLLTWFCFHCYLCYISDKMGEGCCMACCCLPMLRQKLRLTESIEGSICNDMCCSYWCPPCVLCQLKREMDSTGHYN